MDQFRLNRDEAEQILKQIFGLERFYDEQWETISRVFRG